MDFILNIWIVAWFLRFSYVSHFNSLDINFIFQLSVVSVLNSFNENKMIEGKIIKQFKIVFQIFKV